MTQEKTDNLNRSISREVIEWVIKKLLTKKNRGPSGFTDKFYQILKELLVIIHKFFQKIEEEKTLPKSLIPKPRTTPKGGEIYRPISQKYKQKIPHKDTHKILAN